MKQKSILKLLFLLSLGFTFLFAKEVPPKPVHSYVFDENRVLNANEVAVFNGIAEELFNKTGVALALALFWSIDNEDPRSFALRVAESWGIGKKSKDEAFLIFISMVEKRRSVEVAYGAEPYMPDVLVEDLQQKTLVKAFREEQYSKGIISLALALAQHTAQEKGVQLDFDSALNLSQYQNQAQKGPSILFLIVFVLLFIAMLSNPRGRTMLMLLLLNLMASSGQSSSRRGGFGGGRSGGFGGFGGGRFGGGGSGGSW